MATFSQRIEEHRSFMGLSQADIGKILAVDGGEKLPRSTVNNWFTKEQTPTVVMLARIAERFLVSIDWLYGRPVDERWDYRVRQLRVNLKTQVLDIQAEDYHQRMVRIMEIVGADLPTAKEEWFAAGILGFGAQTADENAVMYRRWLTGHGLTTEMLDRTLTRLSDFTGLPRKWILTGRTEHLAPVADTDLGEWYAMVQEYQRMGHTVQQHRRHITIFDSIIRVNEGKA